MSAHGRGKHRTAETLRLVVKRHATRLLTLFAAARAWTFCARSSSSCSALRCWASRSACSAASSARVRNYTVKRGTIANITGCRHTQ